MDDSRFLRDLARTAREEEAEEQQRWERWERLTDGTLSSEEEAELLAEDRMAFEAFRPLGSDFQARMVEAIGPLISAKAASSEEEAPAVDTHARGKETRPAKEEESRGRLPFPWWQGGLVWRAGFVGSGLAAAAVLVLMVRQIIPTPPTTNPQELPEQRLTRFEPTISTERGDEVLRLPPGGSYKAVVQSAAKLTGSGELVPACYVEVTSSTQRQLLTVSCSIADRFGNGTAIAGSLPNDVPLGPATVWTVLGYSGKLPHSDAIAKLPPEKPFQDRFWVALPQPIEIRSP